jgi:beta-lactam-binding protein with PASTA domain/predicted Ser/Thr protein kinase
MTRLKEGDVVDGRYRVRSLIGSGGMADVWLADDLHLPRRVALKVLHDHFARDPEFIERFRREAESAAALQQVNIVSIFDRGQVDDTYYIAMAYLDGRTLRELINYGLTPIESVAIVRQILEAAGFAHRHGVIHRDLKPMNVIIDSTGLATVTDFGIARAGLSEITEVGSVLGTVHYLSPEQAEGLEVGPGSDIYSVGVILYECLTGRVPFEGDTAVAVALKQLSEQPPAPSALNPDVSPALDQVVMTALRREPYDRFPDAESFIAALDAAEAYPNELAPEPARKWPWVVGVVAMVLIALILLGMLRDNSVQVPSVVGSDLDSAISKLSSEGFSVGDVERVKQQVPINQVVNQDPVGKADRDCRIFGWFCSDPNVNLTVSGGPGQVEVPDVTGQTREEAEQALGEAGLGVSFETQSSSDVPEDTVISTDPAAGESVRRGSEVTVTVSGGPGQVAVPPVVGQTRSAAEQQLSARGLEASFTEETSDRPAGEVISQSPDAGTRVDSGSTVELVVSTGPPPDTVDVPNVVGLNRTDAVAQITGLGLSPSVEERSTDIQPQDGRVIDQNPGGGSTVNQGTRIVLIVGVYDGSGGAGPDGGNP